MTDYTTHLLPRPYDPKKPYTPEELTVIVHACDRRQPEIHRLRSDLEREEQALTTLRSRARALLSAYDGISSMLDVSAQPADVLGENERLVAETIEEQIEEGGQ